MKGLEQFFKALSSFIWGNWLLYVLIGVGILYTVSTNFIQFRLFKYAINESIIKPFTKKDKVISGFGTITPFQALSTALASCVGSGNIIGVSTAIISGGPGAIFWMWIAAIVGMATKYGEIVLGMKFREKNEKGQYIGGPMYYIRDGLKMPKLAILTAVFMTIQIIGGNLIQSNAISGVLTDMFFLPPILSAIVIFIFVYISIAGEIKRLSKLAEKIVPLMAFIYLLGALTIIFLNMNKIPHAFLLIFKSAFNFKAGIGGVVGYTIKDAMRYGVARGLYSNEAGEGSAPVLHSVAITDHPARQGLFGITEVFIDTIVISTATALVIIITGIYNTDIPANIMVSEAFATVNPLLKYVVGISLILFSYTSLTVQWYFGYVGISYLLGVKKASKFKYIFPFFTIIGALSSIKLVWYIQDTALGLLVIPNLIALIVLLPIVIKSTKEFSSYILRT